MTRSPSSIRNKPPAEMPSPSASISTLPPVRMTVFSAEIPLSAAVIRVFPLAISSFPCIPPAEMPSSPDSSVRVPARMRMLFSPLIPSPPASAFSIPDSQYSSLSSPVREMPSSPAFRFSCASMIQRLSLTCRASAAASTVIDPPVRTSSSLQTIPLSSAAVTVRLPVPLIVRSSREKIAPSMPAVRFSVEKPKVVRLFSLPSARLRNTLSACSTSRHAPVEHEISAPSSMIQTLALPSASTITQPSARVPEITYFPLPVIMTLPSKA